MKKNLKPIAFFLVFSMILTSFPILSHAKWRDMDRNLPGYSDGPTTGEKIIIIGGGVVIAGGLIYLLVKKKKTIPSSFINPENGPNRYMSATPTNVLKNQNFGMSFKTPATTLFIPNATFMQKLENSVATVPVNLIVAPMTSNSNLALGNTNGVQVGLQIRF